MRRFDIFMLASLIACGGRPAPHVPTARLEDLDDSYFGDEARRASSLAACPAVERPFLWRVERAGASSYLFGTRHVGVGAGALPDSVRVALEASNIVVFETLRDDGELDIKPHARSLRDEVGADAWARFVALVGAERADAVETPVQAVVVLSTLFVDTDAMLDDELEAYARDHDKRLVGLERPADLAAIVERTITASTLRDYLFTSRGRRALRDKELAELGTYCAGRDRAPDPDDDRLRESLVVGRNRAWLPALDEVLGHGGAFVAVGVGHMAGTGGLVEMLRARGYTLTRD